MRLAFPVVYTPNLVATNEIARKRAVRRVVVNFIGAGDTRTRPRPQLPLGGSPLQRAYDELCKDDDRNSSSRYGEMKMKCISSCSRVRFYFVLLKRRTVGRRLLLAKWFIKLQMATTFCTKREMEPPPCALCSAWVEDVGVSWWPDGNVN